VPTSATGHEEEAQTAPTGHEEAQATATGQEKKSAATADHEQALAEAQSSATGQRRKDDKPLLDPPEIDDETGPLSDRSWKVSVVKKCRLFHGIVSWRVINSIEIVSESCRNHVGIVSECAIE
jgi:hypothetical protein